MADTTTSDKKALKDQHAVAIAQFKFIAETEHDQRARELEALKFQAGDQWPDDAKTSRQGTPASASNANVAVPARPMLVMRTLDQPIAQVVNQEHDADLAVTIVAKDGKANEATADVIGGLVRAIQVDSYADDVYSWGFQRMSACGRGYWRVNKAYADERGGIDQVLRVEPIENGFSVYLDPLPKWQPNGGFWEPEYAFVTQDVSEADYQRDYGDSKLATATDSELLAALGDDRKHWVLEGEAGKTYRIAECFYAVYEPETTADGRTIQTRRIKWAKLNGVEWLDAPQDWDGRFIPIIEDRGNTYNIGGQTIIEGMVQPAMSPCRMLNYMVSAAAEKIGLASMAPWIGVAGQFQNFEAWWDQANVRNFSKLEYNAVTAGTGSALLPPPTRNNDEPAIQAFAEMIGLFTNFIRSTTGVPDAALGHINPNDRSGRAIEELKIASQQGTSGWLTHHARAIRHTGIVLVDLIPHIYDAPGRVERIIGKEGTESWVMLNQPFVRDEQGQPTTAPQPGMFSRMAQATGLQARPQIEHHELDKGRYAVIVNVGKSKQTLKAETFAGMNALATAAPELVPRFADLWVESMDIPQAEAIAARIKPPGVDNDNAIPPEAQAQIQQLQQALQEAMQLADDNKAKMAVAEQNNQAKVMTAQSADETKLQIAASQDQTKVEVAAINAHANLAMAEMKAGIDSMANEIRMLAEIVKARHLASLEDMGHEHAAMHRIHDTDEAFALKSLEHAQKLELLERTQAHESNIVDKQADIAAAKPKASDNG